jgi:hypothetical protein
MTKFNPGIPILTGTAARRFISMMEKAERVPKTDFGQQMRMLQTILAKAKLNEGK